MELSEKEGKEPEQYLWTFWNGVLQNPQDPISYEPVNALSFMISGDSAYAYTCDNGKRIPQYKVSRKTFF